MKPDQPTLAPLGKSSIRSEVFDNLLSIEGRGTRLFSNAEAAIEEVYNRGYHWSSCEGHLVEEDLSPITVRAKTTAISDFRNWALVHDTVVNPHIRSVPTGNGSTAFGGARRS